MKTFYWNNFSGPVQKVVVTNLGTHVYVNDLGFDVDTFDPSEENLEELVGIGLWNKGIVIEDDAYPNTHFEELRSLAQAVSDLYYSPAEENARMALKAFLDKLVQQ